MNYQDDNAYDEYEDDEDIDAEETSGNVQAEEEPAGGPIDQLVDLVDYMIRDIVDDPEQVQIIPQQFGSNVHIKLVVPESDMGRVIGRQGRSARSMRTLLTIAASRKGLRASLDIDS